MKNISYYAKKKLFFLHNGRRKRSTMMKISKKKFWILTILYAAVTLLLNNVLHTAIRECLIQISYLALALGIIFLYTGFLRFQSNNLFIIVKSKKKSSFFTLKIQLFGNTIIIGGIFIGIYCIGMSVSTASIKV